MTDMKAHEQPVLFTEDQFRNNAMWNPYLAKEIKEAYPNA